MSFLSFLRGNRGVLVAALVFFPVIFLPRTILFIMGGCRLIIYFFLAASEKEKEAGFIKEEGQGNRRRRGGRGGVENGHHVGVSSNQISLAFLSSGHLSQQ